MKIIFKHSYKCPVSRAAKQEMEEFLDDTELELDYEFVDVFENRSRSDEVAEIYGIAHESPQVIILDDKNNVIWQGVHREVKEEKIREALSQY
ncbi:MAG: bacillithiol system redox-active protein YtxJ [bacterium]|nr:bacillithiol system redox-active protein YtxJ [bacterium]